MRPPSAASGVRRAGPSTTSAAGRKVSATIVVGDTPTTDQIPNSRIASTLLTASDAKPSTVVKPFTATARPISLDDLRDDGVVRVATARPRVARRLVVLGDHVHGGREAERDDQAAERCW